MTFRKRASIAPNIPSPAVAATGSRREARAAAPIRAATRLDAKAGRS